jgi:hypothetical protein
MTMRGDFQQQQRTEDEMSILSGNHWTLAAYRQRMTTKQWREVLLEEGDTIVFAGTPTNLKAKNLGYGVVEVYKDLPIPLSLPEK